jgi:hypothetical protein
MCGECTLYGEQDALEPAFALLQKVPERERRLLVHLALHEVERVAVSAWGVGVLDKIY